MKIREFISSLGIALICGLISVNSSIAQIQLGASELERVQESLRRDELTSTERSIFMAPYDVRKDSLEWGGWLNVSYYAFDEEDNQQGKDDILDDLFNLDNRIWIKKTTTTGNFFYLRTKTAYRRFGWSRGITFDLDDTEQLGIDMAYVDFGAGPKHRFRLGRQYLHLGRGLVYSNVHDALSWNGMFGNWSLSAFFSQSLPNENNLDYSVPGASDAQKRHFISVSGRYRTSRGSDYYLYYLTQRDNSTEKPEDNGQEYDYDSQYLGFGTEGLFSKDFQYYAELVREDGKSFARGQNTVREQIDAWAAILGTKYYSQARTHPVFSLEWAFGSGDGDRNNVLTTANGNLAGTKDRNFLYFGSYDGGSALAPRLSNMSILRLGFSFKPFEKYWRFKDFTFSAIYSDYTRLRENGAISDLEATIPGVSDIGKEIDLYVKWRIFSDLSLNMNFAKFDPGDAFAVGTRDSETLFMTSISFNY
ncbi:MAG: hypothetical protein CVV64_07970 [Candidatus Wallbacteria bacterium HGW-Wallbacteria-1]|jgi:hypothetical protein|uniref:Alginate export domain-containing protein n=1 Tax=Candidatus Wallbacteria bacterium HGW-Wallbacteria-1 TaxID=2013854 RepID=A0A2N1PR43_9BACT|nr:MAG: hypothetical protein CVV64_07970 [Candidatus Wallbacteria bacterium HGW-Wallbacteria-1]